MCVSSYICVGTPLYESALVLLCMCPHIYACAHLGAEAHSLRQDTRVDDAAGRGSESEGASGGVLSGVGGEGGEGVLLAGGAGGREDAGGASGGERAERDKAETEREKDTTIIAADVHSNTHTHTYKQNHTMPDAPPLESAEVPHVTSLQQAVERA